MRHSSSTSALDSLHSAATVVESVDQNSLEEVEVDTERGVGDHQSTNTTSTSLLTTPETVRVGKRPRALSNHSTVSPLLELSLSRRRIENDINNNSSQASSLSMDRIHMTADVDGNYRDNSNQGDSTQSQPMQSNDEQKHELGTEDLHLVANAAALSSFLEVPSNSASEVPPPKSVITTNAKLPQLYVIYMPKTNFKRFVVNDPLQHIYRAPKIGDSHLPMVMRNSNSIQYKSVKKAISAFPPLIPSLGEQFEQIPIDSVQDVLNIGDCTILVSMEDVLNCLDSHGVLYHPNFVWMDLSDFGLRFVDRTLNDIGRAYHEKSSSDIEASDMYGGLWFNMVNKSHLTAHHFSHPMIGEGFAVVLSLELLTKHDNQIPSNSATQSSPQSVNTAQPVPSLISRANDDDTEIGKHSASISKSNAIAAVPNPKVVDIQRATVVMPSSLGAHAVSTALASTPTPIPENLISTNDNSSLASTSASLDKEARRKVRPVESIGEMLDRIADYQRIRSQVKSKNKACEKLGYSKGTINAYREKVRQATQLGINLNELRKTKYRDFKRIITQARSKQPVKNPIAQPPPHVESRKTTLKRINSFSELDFMSIQEDPKRKAIEDNEDSSDSEAESHSLKPKDSRQSPISGSSDGSSSQDGPTQKGSRSDGPAIGSPAITRGYIASSHLAQPISASSSTSSSAASIAYIANSVRPPVAYMYAHVPKITPATSAYSAFTQYPAVPAVSYSNSSPFLSTTQQSPKFTPMISSRTHSGHSSAFINATPPIQPSVAIPVNPAQPLFPS